MSTRDNSQWALRDNRFRRAALQIARDIVAMRNAHIGRCDHNAASHRAYEKAQKRRIDAIEALGVDFDEAHAAALLGTRMKEFAPC